MEPCERKSVTRFRFRMDRRRLILGLIWLPIYIFVLPLLLPLLQNAYPNISDSYANFIIEALSADSIFNAWDAQWAALDRF